MLDILVTAAVLSNGTAVKEKQKLNILFILVTAAVFNNGMLVRDKQS